jgi:hypothetical protein
MRELFRTDLNDTICRRSPRVEASLTALSGVTRRRRERWRWCRGSGGAWPHADRQTPRWRSSRLRRAPAEVARNPPVRAARQRPKAAARLNLRAPRGRCPDLEAACVVTPACFAVANRAAAARVPAGEGRHGAAQTPRHRPRTHSRPAKLIGGGHAPRPRPPRSRPRALGDCTPGRV